VAQDAREASERTQHDAFERRPSVDEGLSGTNFVSGDYRMSTAVPAQFTDCGVS
jgi:hypothetical protein